MKNSHQSPCEAQESCFHGSLGSFFLERGLSVEKMLAWVCGFKNTPQPRTQQVSCTSAGTPFLREPSCQPEKPVFQGSRQIQEGPWSGCVGWAHLLHLLHSYRKSTRKTAVGGRSLLPKVEPTPKRCCFWLLL